MIKNWDVDAVRAAFPSLSLTDESAPPRAYLDAPAGSQVAGRVADRVSRTLIEAAANARGQFRTSRAADQVLEEAHGAMAALLGASGPDEIVFGLNATSLLFSFSRMISRTWREGDEIVLTRMDHDANVAPWLIAAEERGVTVKWLDFDVESYRYRYQDLEHLIGPRTRLVACNHASNLLGTINDVAAIVKAARSVGAITAVDGVQSTPHMLIDVQALGCDLFACSAYKFFGPHAAALYVRRELLAELTPLKVRPSSNEAPWRFAPGTPSFEAQAGTTAAIEHIAWLGEAFGGAGSGAPLRDRLERGWAAASAYELELTRLFLAGLDDLAGVRLYGVRSENELGDRVGTFSFTVPGRSAREVVAHLADKNIFGWAGSFYAHEAARTLGIDQHGVVRLGVAHYTSREDVERAIRELGSLIRA
jgi:cysteine desulfurase family protein (TIGR01976 family)